MDDPLPAVPPHRYFKYQVPALCPETESSLGGELQFSSLYFDFYRNGVLRRKYTKCYSNSFWIMVRDLYNTLVRKT